MNIELKPSELVGIITTIEDKITQMYKEERSLDIESRIVYYDKIYDKLFKYFKEWHDAL